MLKVLKFGGTSVGCAENMRRVARIVVSEGANLVVLSAMSGTTDMLLSIAAVGGAGGEMELLVGKYKQCVEELLDDKEVAMALIDSSFDKIKCSCDDKEILAQGELLTSAIFTLYLSESGVRTKLLNAPDYIVFRGDEHPAVADIKVRMADVEWGGGIIYVTQGFICGDGVGRLSNLGRGGSDYSAALFGAAMGASEVQIWTDIDGIHNNDPRYVEHTYPIRKLHFDEAAELAYFGAKVLHPATIVPCKEWGIPVRLKNSMNPQAQGTIITNDVCSEGDYVAVAAKDGITTVRITSTNMLMAYGFLRQVFEVFERYRTPIDMIATSEVSVSLTIDNDEHINQIMNDLRAFGAIEIERGNTIVCVVGRLGQSECGRAMRILEAVSGIPVKMISYGASNRSVSFIVDMSNKIEVLNSLNKNLFLC